MHEAKAQSSQIEMKRVFVPEQICRFPFTAGRNKPWLRKPGFEQGDDVVALDVNGAVENQDRHQTARIDAQEPGLVVLMLGKIDQMRFPFDAFQVQEDPRLLRTRRHRIVQEMHPAPGQHLAGFDIGVY